jgi:hypothetical protein
MEEKVKQGGEASCFERNPKKTIFSVILFMAIVLLAFFEIIMVISHGAMAVNWYGNNFFEKKTDGRAFGLKRDYSGRFVREEFDIKVETNGFGIRDPRSVYEIAASEKGKVLFMGDSFTFGYGVDYEHLYSTRFGEMAANEGERGYTAFSTGYDNGFGPVQQEFYLKKYFDLFEPDIVVLGFFMQNDLIDGRMIEVKRGEADEVVGHELLNHRIVGGSLVDGVREGGLVDSVRGWIGRHFYTYHALAGLPRALFITAMKVKAVLASGGNGGEPQGRAFGPAQFFIDPEQCGSSYVEAMESILEMDRFVKSRGKIFIVLFIPSNFQVSREYHGYMASFDWGYDEGRMELAYEKAEPQKFIAEKYFDVKEVLYIDPTERFRKLEEHKALYFNLDAHWTPQGHMEAARVLFEFMTSRAMLK